MAWGEVRFRPWTQRTDKHYQLRSGLERKLAEIASRHCQGDAQKLGNDFMRAEVTTFILSCVETHLGDSWTRPPAGRSPGWWTARRCRPSKTCASAAAT
ncbi:70 kDa antigen [Chromobacterium violaceum]|uniref:70 kDa antigen n=1 Tax=Chromobacterium violaceum TaxID=536 RepID=A0A3S4HS35_CHRVL|nr:70 kDa antigen [Chromobacterium violaceum]